jgi:hypothetical protein
VRGGAPGTRSRPQPFGRLREERLAGGGEIGTQRGGQIAGRVQREVAQDGAHEQQRQLDNVRLVLSSVKSYKVGRLVRDLTFRK